MKELLPGLDTTDYLAKAEKAEKEGRKREAAEFYAKYGNFSRAGKIAEELKDEELALRYYDHGYNPKSVFFRFIPAEPEDAGRIYEKKGMLREALNRYHLGGGFENAGRVAEKLNYYKEALNYYKDELDFLKRPGPKEKFRDTKRIKKIEEKIRNLETKLESKLESNKKTLDSKITLFFIIISFLISLFFLSFNITGNTILNIGTKSSNFLGFVFVLVGILVFFIYKNRNKIKPMSLRRI